MKTFIIAPMLTLTAVSGVVATSHPAAAGGPGLTAAKLTNQKETYQ